MKSRVRVLASVASLLALVASAFPQEIGTDHDHHVIVPVHTYHLIPNVTGTIRVGI
jgi:hypothetical protein